MVDRWTGPGIAFLALASIAGCSSSYDAQASVAARDSAGVAVIELAAREGADASLWTIPGEPGVSIGSVDGPPEYQFFRISAVLRMGDGTLLVADNGSKSIRFFDSAGVFSHSVGREGAGPGEYRLINLLGHYGPDSLVAWDSPLRRATVLNAEGEFARTFEGGDFGDSFVYFQEAIGDGSLLGSVDDGVRPNELPVGVYEASTTYLRLHPSGQVDTIGEFFGNEALITSDHAIIDMPLGRVGVRTATPTGFHYSANDDFELRSYSLDGELTRIVRMPDNRRPLTRADVDKFVQVRLDQIRDPAALRRTTAWYADVPWPRTLPAFSELQGDSEGNLWAAEYRLADDEPYRWTVIAPDGHVLAVATTPGALRIRDIGSDYILGVERDEFDVERVVLYHLTKE